MHARTHRFVPLDTGASAVEYALLVSAIAAAIVAVVFVFGTTLSGIFQSTCNSIGTSAGTGSC